MAAAIQPCALLLLVGPDWCIEAVSENCAQLGKGEPKGLLGQPLTMLLDSQEIHELRNRMAWLGGDNSRVQDFGLSWGGGSRTYDVQASRDADSFLIEAETSAERRLHDPIGMARSLMDRVDGDDFSEIAAQGLRQLRALTGFERVLLYDCGGSVVATSERDNAPATDQIGADRHSSFPAIIADCDAAPVNLIGKIGESALQHAAFLAPDEQTREGLATNGVRAAMTLPLMIDGDWVGTLHAHHSEPRRCGAERRTVAGLFADRLAARMARHGWTP